MGYQKPSVITENKEAAIFWSCDHTEELLRKRHYTREITGRGRLSWMDNIYSVIQIAGGI